MPLCTNCLSSFSETYVPPEPASSKILSSNNPLTEAETLDFRRRIADASSKLEVIESEIVQLRSLLKQYETARDDCKTYIAAHQRLFSPVHSVPPEIWSEIFQCHHRSHVKGNTPVAFSLYNPFAWHNRAFGAVCSLWRNVMENAPVLWANVTLSSYSFSVGAYEMLELWLKRSKQLPITVYIQGTSLRRDVYSRFFECVNLLLQHGQQWQMLHLRMHPTDHADENDGESLMEHWPYPLESTPLLENCSLEVGDYHNPIIVHAPLLKTVKRDFSDYDEDCFPANTIPWGSVTELQLSHQSFLTTEELDSYLEVCPILEHFTIRCSDRIESAALPARSHSRLKALSVIGGSPTVLANLTAPALTSLKLSCDDDEVGTHRFIQRSSNLESLSLHQHYELLSVDDFSGVIQIKELSMSGTELPMELGRLADALDVFAERIVLPGVRSLRLQVDIRSRDTDPDFYTELRNAVLGLCENRLHGHCPNKSELKLISIKISTTPINETVLCYNRLEPAMTRKGQQWTSSSDEEFWRLVQAYCQDEFECLFDLNDAGINGLSVELAERVWF